MPNYLITHHSHSDESKKQEFYDYAYNALGAWASEGDEGLYFVSCEGSPGMLFDKIINEFNLDFDMVYVFELSGPFASNGTTKVMRAIEEKLAEQKGQNES